MASPYFYACLKVFTKVFSNFKNASTMRVEGVCVKGSIPVSSFFSCPEIFSIKTAIRRMNTGFKGCNILNFGLTF